MKNPHSSLPCVDTSWGRSFCLAVLEKTHVLS